MTRQLLFLIPLLTAACASVAPAPDTRDRPQVMQHEPSAEDARAQVLYTLMLGELAGLQGQVGRASSLYLEAASLSRDPRVAERATRIALFARDEATAAQALELWKSLEPENADRWEVETVLHLRAGREAQALETIEGFLARQDTDRPRAYLRLAAMLTAEGQPGLRLMHAVAQRHPQEGEAWLVLAQMAMHFREFETAQSALRKLIRLQPERKEAYLMLASSYFRAGDIDRGLAEIEQAVEAFPQDRELRLNYARALVEARRYDEALPLFQQLLREDPKDANLRLSVALLALEAQDLDTAERELRTLHEQPEMADLAAYYLGRLFEQRGDEEAAREWYGRVKQDEVRMDALIRLAAMDARQGRLERARAQLAEARASTAIDENKVRLYLAESDLLRESGQFEAALQLLDQALQAYPGEPDLLYTRALIADRLGRFEEAEANLRAILEQDPEHVDALNALGYTLAQRNIRLDEAYALIDKALRLAPDNPAILDSMGWVLYRQGKLAEAEGFLRQAYARDPDGEIAAHLAEVLAALGRREEALGLIDEALAREPGRAELLDVQRRLQQP